VSCLHGLENILFILDYSARLRAGDSIWGVKSHLVTALNILQELLVLYQGHGFSRAAGIKKGLGFKPLPGVSPN